MDDEGLERRRKGPLRAEEAYDLATGAERDQHFERAAGRPRWRRDGSREQRRHFETIAFNRMGYDEKLEHCLRPEEIAGPSAEAWERINAHLKTHASSLAELVEELGRKRFGHVPRVGDAFCGGGSIPFEAARIGCEAFGSDLSPVAGLLTWGALNIVGGGELTAARVQAGQRRTFERVRAQIDDWGIERNERGWTADAYLYCAEVTDPTTGWRVPLAPSWVIATKTNVIARLVPDPKEKQFEIELVEGASADEMRRAAAEGTSAGGVRSPVDRNGTWLPPERRQSTSLEQLRGREGLRLWDAGEVVPAPTDVYQERLYCVRWVDPETGERHYRAPTVDDLDRDERVLELLRERLTQWQDRGFVPRRRIASGRETDRLQRERGWTHWHQLFNPRQLLLNGLLAEASADEAELEGRGLLLMVGRLSDWNSRLSIWLPAQGGGIGGGKNTFYNQTYNTLNNYSCRTMTTLEDSWCVGIKSSKVALNHAVDVIDARAIETVSDIWITDPGYADAIPLCQRRVRRPASTDY